MIPSALGVCFFLIWLFIGGMIFRDCQIAARRERESDGNILPLAPRRVVRIAPGPNWGMKAGRRNRVARVAS